MFCNKCGNELKENTKFCSKCGNPIINDVKQVINEDSKQSSLIRNNKIIITISIIVILVISLGVIMNITLSDNGLIKSTKTTLDSAEKSNKKETSKKNYYKFIDTQYFTFKFTEEELLSKIMGGTYSAMGYKKVESNTANTNRYKYESPNLSEKILDITTNPLNNKVSSFTMHYINYYDEDEIEERMDYLRDDMIMYIMITQGEKEEKITGEDLIEIKENKSYNKGISINCNSSKAGTFLIDISVTIQIVK